MIEPELDFNSAIGRISQLEQHQNILLKQTITIKRQLHELKQKFNNRPELEHLDNFSWQLINLSQELAEIQKQLSQSPTVGTRLDNGNISKIEETSNTTRDAINLEQQSKLTGSYDYNLVCDRSGSRAVLLEALDKAQERLIIVCPWLNRNSIDVELIQKFRDCLERNCRIDIGWGHYSDGKHIGKGWRYNALKDLRQLEQDYPAKFSLKLLGTHEKFLVCDSKFAMLGSHNILTSSDRSIERELGIFTTDSQIIKALIDRFNGADVQIKYEEYTNLSDISENMDEEATEILDIEEPESVYVNNDNEDDEDEDELLDEEILKTAISAEEFLQRISEGETDFTGINLAGVDLAEKSLGNHRFSLNLSQANLIKALLKKANLSYVNLNGADFRGTDIRETTLPGDLSKVNFKKVDLRQVNLQSKTLDEANLEKANLSGVNLSQSSLNAANLNRANLSGTYLRKVKLVNADLSKANLRRANLLEANLEGANLEGANLQQAIYNQETVFPTGFDPVKAGAYLIAPKTVLKNAYLVGADLSNTKLSGAKLQGANMNSANLTGAELIEANLSAANLDYANLESANLIEANLSAASLVGVKLNYANLTTANLSGANLMEAQLKSTNLTAANLTKANLKKAAINANFSGANLTDVNLVGVSIYGNLSGITFTNAKLCGVNLRGQNLSWVKLDSADLRGADLSGANLEKANLKDAIIAGANLAQANLTGATMPDGTIRE